MKFLLDTNALIHLMKLRDPLANRVRLAGPAAFAVCTISLAEVWYGAARSRRPQQTRADQDAVLAAFRVLDFDSTAADRYASVRAHLANIGAPIGDRDLMIAAIALANRMAVVTSNVSEFERVPGLTVEDWMV